MQIRRSRQSRADSLARSPGHAGKVRCGFTLVELIVAAVIMSVVMTVSLQMLAGLAQQQRLAGRRQLAADELANLMERITARKFSALTDEALQSLTISETVQEQLPDSQLQLQVTTHPGPPEVKRIAAEIRWRDVGGGFTAPVRLVAWRYVRTGGEQ